MPEKREDWGLHGSVMGGFSRRSSRPANRSVPVGREERRDSPITKEVKLAGPGFGLDEGVGGGAAGVRADFQFLAWP